MPGHGPASAITGNPNDNRRVINIVINNLGNPNDPTSWYDPTINGPNAAIEAAVREAANRWNNATDQFGNQTGYYFNVIVSQSNADIAVADVIVRKAQPSIPGACMEIEPWSDINPDPLLTIPPDGPSRPADRLAGDLTHELGHPLGLHDAGAPCAAQTVMNPNMAGSCSAPVPSNEAAGPTAADITMVNYFLNNGPAGCSTTRQDPPSCSDPCSDASCPGFSEPACCNQEDERLEQYPGAGWGGACYATYDVVSHYRCGTGTGCVLIQEDWTYLYDDCSSACGQCLCGAECNFGQCGPPIQGCTPIIIAVGENANYQLTSAEGGVLFDMDGNGVKERVPWTLPNDPIAFLVLDLNGNGTIDNGTELFGNYSIVPGGGPVGNGYEALAYYDQNMGNRDGVIDSRDAIWTSLRLWIDSNHDGISQGGELYTLNHWQLSSISLQFQTINRQDGYGNVYRLQAACKLRQQTRFSYDVYFSMKPQKRPN